MSSPRRPACPHCRTSLAARLELSSGTCVNCGNVFLLSDLFAGADFSADAAAPIFQADPWRKPGRVRRIAGKKTVLAHPQASAGQIVRVVPPSSNSRLLRTAGGLLKRTA